MISSMPTKNPLSTKASTGTAGRFFTNRTGPKLIGKTLATKANKVQIELGNTTVSHTSKKSLIEPNSKLNARKVPQTIVQASKTGMQSGNVPRLNLKTLDKKPYQTTAQSTRNTRVKSPFQSDRKLNIQRNLFKKTTTLKQLPKRT